MSNIGHAVCERPGGCILHPEAMLPDARVLCRTPSRSSNGSTVSHPAGWGFQISMVENMPQSGRFVATMLLQKSEKREKTEKSALLLFQLERAVAQFVANKTEGWGFSDFSKNFRGYGGVCSKSVVQIVGSGFCRRYRSVTVGNGNLFRLDCHTFAFNWIGGRKIKVAQGGSRWLKVNQPILKHFFITATGFRNRSEPASGFDTWRRGGKIGTA